MNKIGKVFLIGAGPGDPELITVKAVKHLKTADIVLTDRLVSDEILSLYTSSSAKIIYVGKDGCNKEKSVSQQETNEMIVEFALKGKKVIRLKGGDVAFFSNVLDELTMLNKYQIEYEIIPGITSASGASAYAGIPLTARNYSKGVRFLTYSKEKTHDKNYWKELAQTSDTLVFYMTGQIWNSLAKHFIENEVASDKKMAIIEQATTPYQKVYVYDFEALKTKKLKRTFVSPSLIIIGDVVNLHEQFSWKDNYCNNENYFKIHNKITRELDLINVQSA